MGTEVNIGVVIMIKHILFVHGTGVRQPAYDESFATIATHVRQEVPELEVLPCYWGETEGCRLLAAGQSIPDYDSARAIDELDRPELASARWQLLYEDPDFELDAMLGGPDQTQDFVAGTESPLDPILRMIEVNSAETDQAAAALSLSGVWNKAHVDLEAYLTGAALRGRAFPPVDTQFLAALARALVAHALTLQHAEGEQVSTWPTGTEVDDLVSSLVDVWRGTETNRGLIHDAASWIKDRLKRVALNLGTSKVARKRGVLSDAAYPAAGDILLYQARGQGIRDLIEQRITAAPKPLLVLAHSLGGIACVDLLVKKELSGVVQLVTVGSQAPLLYELNALCSLPFGQDLPPYFPQWLNIYDKHDFLSYLAAPIFPNRAVDLAVDNGQPFPESHGAYWLNPDVWAAIGKILK